MSSTAFDCNGSNFSSTAGGGGGVSGPAGNNTEIQYNDSGTLNGASGATYNKSTDAVTIAGVVTGKAFVVSGTAGNGFVTCVTQSSNPSSPASGFRLFGDASGRFAFKVQADGFVRTLGGAITADRVYTVPDATTTLAGTDATQTFTNKRITKRVVTLTDAATVTPDADSTDVGILTSVSQSTTFANPTGTPTDGQILILRVKSTNSQTVSFGNQYRGSVELPLLTSTYGSSKTGYWTFCWNAADSKWDFVALIRGF